MPTDLDEQVSRTLETDVLLLSLLPELLVDLQELGTSADQIVSALHSAGIKPKANVLGLGCGKGAAPVALAERLELRVEGIDALPSFLEAARTLAAECSVSSKCDFRKGDIRDQGMPVISPRCCSCPCLQYLKRELAPLK